MRTILSIIALFSLSISTAQPQRASSGREIPRGTLLVYPSQQQATAADGSNNRYFTRLSAWTQDGNRFTCAFTRPFDWANRQVLFHLGSASADYEICVNGSTVAYNANGNDPAEFNITRYAKEGRNTLEIIVSDPSKTAVLESWKKAPAPTIGQAWVLSQPTLRVRDVLTRAWPTDEDKVMAEIAIPLSSNALNPRTSRLHYELLTPSGKQAAGGFKDLSLSMRREDTVRILTPIPQDSLWSTERPTHYTLRLKTQHEGRYEEYLEFQLGFRTVEMQDSRLSVNGKPITLRIQEVSPQISDQQIALLREQGYNALKLLPGTVRESLYDFCDRQGIYVIAQAAIDTRNSGESRRKGGNPSNDPAWSQAYIERVEDSYHTAKRHPSVIAFSLAEQSANGICLYESYLNMKRFTEPRPFIYPAAAGEWNSDKLNLK